ncbi:methyltransferase [Paraburkholderia sp. UCT31]|uniref:methyltransferase n=1 Tax=Paraburkholderia sp. UCT31 TaxID=2615209 RepID=UPI001655C3AD|nr:methyltransferase [Paraburkholderia sp. UCT31]MBC8738583.1 methyltransferase [Paraburkholderia sp. UCT31]
MLDLQETVLQNSSFGRLLARRAHQKPHYPVFDEGYRSLISTLREPLEYDFLGLKLVAPAGVYHPRPEGSSTSFVATHWHCAGLDEPNGTLLELGCGTGALALLAARRGWKVTAADCDIKAVSAARANAAANGLTVDFLLSDLFAAFDGRKFDVVLFNLPLYHKRVVSADELALADADGQLAARLLDSAKSHLNPGGRLVFTYSNCSDDRLLERDDWHFDVAACDFEGHGRYWRALLVAEPV